MKIILYSLISLFVFTNCLDSNTIREVSEIKGVYVIKYNKEEIKSLLINENLKREGKPYQKAIDLNKELFFIPIKNKINFVSKIEKWDSFQKKDLFFLPFSSRSKDYLKKFRPKKVSLIKPINLPTREYCSFYQFPDDEKYLYRIYYIEGTEIIIELENTGLNKIKLDISDEVDKREKKFNAHFINEIKFIECDKQISGLKIWKYDKS